MRNSLVSYISLLIILISADLIGQYCNPFKIEEIDFQSETRMVKVNAGWYPGWLDYRTDESKYPDPLPPLQKWDHPFMKDNLPSAMHEHSYASDISNMQGPVPGECNGSIFSG